MEISRFKNAPSNFLSSCASPFLCHNFHSWCYSLSSPCNIGHCKGTCHHLHCIVIVLPCIDPDTVLPGAALPSVDNPHQHGPVPIYRVQGAARVSLKTQHQWNLFHEDFIFFVTLLGTRRCLPRRCGVLCLSASSQTLHLHLSCKC